MAWRIINTEITTVNHVKNEIDTESNLLATYIN